MVLERPPERRNGGLVAVMTEGLRGLRRDLRRRISQRRDEGGGGLVVDRVSEGRRRPRPIREVSGPAEAQDSSPGASPGPRPASGATAGGAPFEGVGPGTIPISRVSAGHRPAAL